MPAVNFGTVGANVVTRARVSEIVERANKKNFQSAFCRTPAALFPHHFHALCVNFPQSPTPCVSSAHSLALMEIKKMPSLAFLIRVIPTIARKKLLGFSFRRVDAIFLTDER